MKLPARLATLGVIKGVGFLREILFMVFAIGQGAADAANCYFLAGQAALIFSGKGWSGRLAGGALLGAYWATAPQQVLFSLVVFLPFLLWPQVSKAAYQHRQIGGLVGLTILFNALIFIEMLVLARPIQGFEVPNLFGVPFVALYLTVLGGALLHGVASSVTEMARLDLLLLVAICVVRIVGYAWVPAGFEWIFLAVVRAAEMLYPQWVTLKRVGVRA